MRLISLLFVIFFLCACSSMEPVPGDTFYRLKQISAESSNKTTTPWTQQALVVGRFHANGIYKDRAIVQLQQDGVSLSQSKYHYWNNTPETLLQERFREHALYKNLAPIVALNSADAAEFVVSGRILRFEQEKTDAGADRAVIHLELGVRRAGNRREILFQEQFNFSQEAGGEEMSDLVTIFSLGIDQLFSQFISKASNAITQL